MKKPIKIIPDSNLGITIEELLQSVEELYNKADKDPISRKILDTAKEKWVKYPTYAP